MYKLLHIPTGQYVVSEKYAPHFADVNYYLMSHSAQNKTNYPHELLYKTPTVPNENTLKRHIAIDLNITEEEVSMEEFQFIQISEQEICE